MTAGTMTPYPGFFQFAYVTNGHGPGADPVAANARHPIIGSNPGVARYFYCDLRAELGHYIEGIVFAARAGAWLESIPRS